MCAHRICVCYVYFIVFGACMCMSAWLTLIKSLLLFTEMWELIWSLSSVSPLMASKLGDEWRIWKLSDSERSFSDAHFSLWSFSNLTSATPGSDSKRLFWFFLDVNWLWLNDCFRSSWDISDVFWRPTWKVLKQFLRVWTYENSIHSALQMYWQPWYSWLKQM